MASNSSKTPPLLSHSKSYEDWLKLFKIWRMYTDLPKTRQGPALVLSLEGEAQDAALELSETEIAKENGADAILHRLDRLFKKDSTITKYQALEAFETFKRPSDMSIQSFLNEFEKRLFKTKSYGSVMSDDVLAYRLLKSANLSNNHEQLIKATLPELHYDLMKDQLKKTFSDSSRYIPTKEEDYVKTEEALVAEMNHLDLRQENYFDPPNENEYYPFRDSHEDMYKSIDNNYQGFENQNETFFNKNNYRTRNQNTYRNNQYSYQQTQRPNQPTRFKQSSQKQYPKHRKNPCDRNGLQLRCIICESVYHFAQNCPEARNQNTFFSQEVVLFQADYDHPAKLKNLVSESRNSAILDSGATNTVTGESWMNTYIESLDDQDNKITFRDSTNVYRFGDGKTVPATRNVDIPVMIGNRLH